MANNKIRNPAKAYFKWKMPVIAKSEDDWNFWNTEDKYNRTMFIGYNDLTTPHVASLFLIVDGKAIQAVGDDVLARIAQMEIDISTQMAEIQQLITQANEQQQSINTLRTEVQLVLHNCSAFADEAEIWAEGSDEDVAAYGGEHSAKGWALRAGEIISTGLPSEASFDKLSVTGAIDSSDSSTRVPNTAWVQSAIQAGGGGVSPDSDITCRSITATSGGASLTASYSAERSETTSVKVIPATQGTAGSIVLDARTSNWEYPAQISMTNTLMQAKVPGRMEITVGDTDSSSVDLSISTQPYVSTPWTHQLNCMLPIRANNGLYVKNRSTNESAFIATNTLDDDAETNPKLTVSGTLSVYGERTNTSGSKSSVTMLAHRAASDTDGSYVMLKAENSGSGLQSYMDVQEGETQIGTPKLTYFDQGDKTSSTEAIRLGKASEQAYSTKRYIYSELIGRFVNGLQIGLINDYEPDGVPFKVLRSDTSTSGKWMAAFGITPTVPDIADAADSSDKVPNTKWVQAAIAAGGGGGTGGAVSSVNGQTGAVVLSGQDIKTDPNATNTIYQDWAELSSQISGKQSAIVQDSSLSLNSITLANSSTGTVGTLKLTSQDGAIEFRPNGTYLGGIIGRSGEGMLISGNELHIGYQFSSPTGILVSRTDSKTTHNFATEFTNTVSCSAAIAASDNSQQLATTQWVNAAIAAAGGGGGSGAVTSVNGKTGEVVLSASDVGAASTSDLASYVTTDAMNTELTNFATNASVDTKLADYQHKLIAGDGIAISESNVISVTGGTGGGAVSSVNGKTGEVVLNATDVGAITGTEADTKITTALEPYAKTADVTATLEPYAKSADVTAEITAAVAPLATTEALTTGLAGKQDKLTAGSGIAISADNVISSTVSSPVDSVNGKTGAVVLSGEDIRLHPTVGEEYVYPAVSDVIDSISGYLPDGVSSDNKLVDNSSLSTQLATYQPKLTAGDGITISAENVISATGGSGGGAVTSVNGNTGAVVLTGDNIMTASDSTTSLNSALAGKQASITADTDLTVGSLTAGSSDSGLYAGRYSIRFTSNGNDKLFVDATGPYVSNLTGGDLGPATGAFNWYINTTTDYNKFNVFNRYYVTDEATHEVTTNDTSVLSIGGSPTDHSTWIDFTATYMSFKGNTNFGEAGMNHAMTFNGPSTFTGTATVHELIAGDGYEGTMFTCNANAWLNYDNRIGWDSGRLRCARTDDDFMFDFNHSASSGQRIRFNDTVTILSAMPAATDSSNKVPTTAWVQSAIAAAGGGGSSVPDDITCKTLKVTSWDSGLDSIEFAGNLKYSGDYGNGSLGIITAREFYANASGYYSTRVSTSGIILSYGSGGNHWFNADSSTRILTIDGTLKSSTPTADANNTEVATTAWVNTAITAKAASTNADNFSVAGKAVLAGIGMPSKKFIDVTVGANATTYTAPANGYFFSTGTFSQEDGYIKLYNNTKHSIGTASKAGTDWGYAVFIPCQKGDQAAIFYNRIDNPKLTFLYAEGDQEGENNV